MSGDIGLDILITNLLPSSSAWSLKMVITSSKHHPTSQYRGVVWRTFFGMYMIHQTLTCQLRRTNNRFVSFFFLNCTWLLIYIYVDDACIHSLAFSRWRWSQEVATSKHTPAKSNVKRQTRDLGIWLDIAFLPPYYSYSTVQFVQMTNSPSSRCNCFSSFFLLTSTSSSCL